MKLSQSSRDIVLKTILSSVVDSKISPNFDTQGVLMITTALLFDAVIGNVQEKAMREHKAANDEVVLYSYGIGFVYLFVAMLVSGNVLAGLRFCATVKSSHT